jgi:hypothetical protein
MPNSKNQTDEDKAAYNLCVLRKMFGVLPENICMNLSSQLDKFITELSIKEAEFHSKISSELQDVQVLFKAMQFDLESTKSERDYYKKKLGEIDGHPQ